jgi:hypothetical protein
MTSGCLQSLGAILRRINEERVITPSVCASRTRSHRWVWITVIAAPLSRWKKAAQEAKRAG